MNAATFKKRNFINLIGGFWQDEPYKVFYVMIGIYKITSPLGKIYIGQSSDIERRWIKDYIPYKCKGQTKLYNSLVKHGSRNHIFEIIEECTVELLNDRERYWQEFYNSTNRENGLNLMTTKTKCNSGYHSQETKDKISKTKTGVPNKKSNHKRVYTSAREEYSIERVNGIETVVYRYRKMIILDTHTGIYYTSIKDLCVALNINYNNFRIRFHRRRKNGMVNSLNTKYRFVM